MSDTLYRDFRANEISREIARETRMHSVRQARCADSVHPAHSLRFEIQHRLATMTASASAKVRHLAIRPARS
jgi:hypothetical protein